MKTTKLVINIFSLVFFFFIIFQSCAAGFVNAVSGNDGDSSGIGGLFLALFMLVAAIVGLATRKNESSGIAVAILYLIASIIGFASLGTFGDLVIWASLSLIFAVVYFIGFFLYKKSQKNVVKSGAELQPETPSNE